MTRAVLALASRVPVLAALGLASWSGHAAAAWPNDPAVNVPVCTNASVQEVPAVVSDGEGGVIIAWRDYRDINGPTLDNIYAQRVSASGVPLWTADGVPVCTATSSQMNVRAVSDGAGGTFIVWQDFRAGHFDIYAQRLGPAGQPLWAANGVPVCNMPNHQQNPSAAPDGSGGLLVVWEDYRSGSHWDVYAQRMNASNWILWEVLGLAVCTAAQNQTAPVIAPDDLGGAIIAWEDYRSGTTLDIYAQRIASGGSPVWTANGVPLCDASGHQEEPDITADGAGGAIVAWQDNRGLDLYAQRINASGVVQWTEDGVQVSTTTGLQYYPSVVSDGSFGAYVGWEDHTDASDWNLGTQHLNAAGVKQWPDDLAVCTAWGLQYGLVMVPSGPGNVVYIWEDRRRGPQQEDVYAQKIMDPGWERWTLDGVPVSTAVGRKYYVTAATDGAGGVIAAWTDSRTGPGDIYAQRLDQWGARGAQPAIVSVRDVPNDQGGLVKLSWSPSPLDQFPYPSVYNYRLYRSVPARQAQAALKAGAVLLGAGPEEPLPGRRAFRTTVSGSGITYWEYLYDVRAEQLPGYSMTVPTAFDSIPGSNPLTLFMVEAQASGVKWWFSDPDSGYSVDNLSPGMPASFAARREASGTTLSWSPSPDADVAGYRLHRGATGDFAPGPANLVAEVAGTSYEDADGGPHSYKLCAVDVHGNASAYALCLPSGAVEAAATNLPREVWLGRAMPNPMRNGCALRFGLPRASRVTLAIYDQQGRHVRTLAGGEHSAGEHIARWDGRDGHGRPVPSGLYFARLEVEGRRLTQRFVTLR
jgi:hypothetical protein